MNIIVILYKSIIGTVSFIYLYAVACLIDINIISSILVNLFCLIMVFLFKSYSLLYVDFILVIIIAYRYYYNKKDRINLGELVRIFVFNLINICFSTYALFKMVYCYATSLGIQKDVPFMKISLVEAAPIAYMVMIYSVIVILILSIDNYLLINSNNTQLIIIKAAAAIIIIVLLIIIVNAIIYFIIHNLPLMQTNGIFDGNFLKDPINHFYRSEKPFSDCLWFSATTFFTVGYGDMHPVGNIMYLLSILQMISAYILGIVMMPILLCRIRPHSGLN